MNDVTPPALAPITTRVSAGRPLIAARVLDRQSGIDPFSLVIAYNRVLVGAAAFDPLSGLALFPLPAARAVIKPGKTEAAMEASDNQEAKNVASIGNEPHAEHDDPRPRSRPSTGPAVTWLAPNAGACVKGVVRLARDGDLDRGRLGGALLRRPLADRDGHERPRRASTSPTGARARADGAPRAPGDRARPAGTELHRRPRPSACAASRARRGRHRRVERHRGGNRARGSRGRGWHCVLLARSEERLQALAKEIGGEYEVCDVADRAAVDAVAARVLERHPRIDLLVCSAGIPGRTRVPARRPGA